MVVGLIRDNIAGRDVGKGVEAEKSGDGSSDVGAPVYKYCAIL